MRVGENFVGRVQKSTNYSSRPRNKTDKLDFIKINVHIQKYHEENWQNSDKWKIFVDMYPKKISYPEYIRN